MNKHCAQKELQNVMTNTEKSQNTITTKQKPEPGIDALSLDHWDNSMYGVKASYLTVPM